MGFVRTNMSSMRLPCSSFTSRGRQSTLLSEKSKVATLLVLYFLGTVDFLWAKVQSKNMCGFQSCVHSNVTNPMSFLQQLN